MLVSHTVIIKNILPQVHHIHHKARAMYSGSSISPSVLSSKSTTTTSHALPSSVFIRALALIRSLATIVSPAFESEPPASCSWPSRSSRSGGRSPAGGFPSPPLPSPSSIYSPAHGARAGDGRQPETGRSSASYYQC